MSLINKSIGDNFPNIINAIIEIEKDSSAKYEYCPKMDMLKLDRCLISSMRYPTSYGFIPQTISDDGDPLDVLVYNTVPLLPLSFVEVRPIGVLCTLDNEVSDCKILGIPLYNPNNYNDIDEIDETFLDVCEDFFKHYKNNNRKNQNRVKILGWEGKESAIKMIKEKHQAYQSLSSQNIKQLLLD
jgi:inorganic pyrophosphatase